MTNSELIAAGGILGGMFATIMICALVFYVLIIIAEWKIFDKAGEAGWKALIPIYNFYIVYKISGISFLTWFLVPYIVVPFCAGIINGIIPSLQIVTALIQFIVCIIATIKMISALADSFGKGTGFKVGLFFLPNVFTLILGFGSAEYKGPAGNNN